MRRIILLLILVLIIYSCIYTPDENIINHFINEILPNVIKSNKSYSSEEKDISITEYLPSEKINNYIRYKGTDYFISQDSERIIETISKDIIDIIYEDNNKAIILANGLFHHVNGTIKEVFIINRKDRILYIDLYIPKYTFKIIDNDIYLIINDEVYRKYYDSIIVSYGHDLYYIGQNNKYNFSKAFYNIEYHNKSQKIPINELYIDAVGIQK